MKMIKFDLPIDGVKVKNIEELREHFTIEILDHFRRGLLGKWLASRRLQDEFAAVKALDGLDDHALLKGLCGVFGVEADDLVIAEILKEPATASSGSLVEQTQHYVQLAEAIDSAIYEAIRTQGILKTDSFDLYDIRDFAHTDYFYKSEKLIDGGTYYVPVAPSIGRIDQKFPFKNNCRSSGDIIGWFLMSEYAEDYCSSWHNFVSIVDRRKQILSSMAEKVRIPLLKKSLDDRVMWLTEIIALLKDDKKDYISSDYIKKSRKKRNLEKLEFIKRLPAKKKAMISGRTGFFSLKLGSLKSINIFKVHQFLSSTDKQEIERDYKKGTLICANDKIGNIFSTVTGVVADIKIDDWLSLEIDVSN